MLKTFFGKIIAFLVGLLLLIIIFFLGLQVFFSWKNSQYSNAKLKILQSKDEYQRMKDEEATRQMTQEQKKYFEKLNKGYNEKGTLLKWDEAEGEKGGYLGINGHSEATNTKGRGEGVLIYTDEQVKHFNRILEDIDDFLNNEGELNLDVEGERNKDDQYKNYLLRNNCILYGAPGTGKTEFVRELNHVLIDRYGIKPNELPDSDDSNDPANAWKKDKEGKEDNLPKPQVPVFQINGLDISSTGKDEPKIYEKLILCLKKLKNDFFKVPDEKGEIGEFSNLPYIAFIDEADQAKNPFTFRPENKNNLEELKNFFSTSEDSQGLKANAQDPNSIFVIATNNYETIDPAMKRRGRLGKSLNFTFNPLTLQKYSEEVNWPQINGEEHHDWKFQGNRDFHLLLKLAEKMNFDNIREKFIPKTQKMLEEWNEWEENEKEQFARNRLGIESQVWCAVCGKETEPEKPSQTISRVKRACEGIEDEKEKQEIREEELKRKLTACEGEHEAQVICNWLLHYIYTFFKYADTQQLENYNHPNQTERYEFDKGRLLRERLQQFQKDVYETSVDLINVCGEELRRNSETFKQLNSLQEGSYEILSGIEKNLGEIETQIRDYVRAKIND
ncbi:MAG: hypothetical protein MRERV_7c079 [Mycoplasmataceae bacterium RV_VA103A]|nr:MAG: hypothetical protein MRERV_7c079 [Mycoplasmataceae bacterium RV_VA103A]